MAGTLTISTLSDGTNSTSSTNCIQGSAKAWVQFNGYSTASIRASYNVSSVTRAAQGAYFITFTNALADANYAVNANCSPNNDGSVNGNGTPLGPLLFYYANGGTGLAPTSSGFRVSWTWSTAGYPDPTYVCISVFR